MVIVLPELMFVVAMAVEVVVEVDKILSMMLLRIHDPAGLSNRVDPPYTLRRASRSQNQLSVSSQPSVSSWLTGSQTQTQPGELSRNDLTNTNAQSDMNLVIISAKLIPREYCYRYLKMSSK